jgi:trimeric autotransporter adhesin
VPGQAAPFSGTLPASLVNGSYNNFSPRIGLAWRPPFSKTMTVRSGYSVMYNGAVYNRFASSMASQPPFAQAETLQSSATQLLTLQNGFPVTSANTLRNTIAIDPNYKLAYAQVWTLSVDGTGPHGIILGATYTGTKGTHLDTLLGFSSPNAQGFTYDTAAANSIYQALRLRMVGRMSRNLRFGVNYALGKSIDDASSIGGGQQIIAQNSFDLAAERGLSSFDIRHQLSANYSYDLPFGERQRFARSGWTSSVLSDFTVLGTFNAHTGLPFSPRAFDPACQIIPGVYSERANLTGDPNLSAGTVQQFFNTAAFAVPTGTCIGNAGRNIIEGPGTFTMGMSLSKNIRLDRDGQRRLTLRWDVTNLTNNANFTGISTVVNSATFGRVTGVSGMRTMAFHARVNF